MARRCTYAVVATVRAAAYPGREPQEFGAAFDDLDDALEFYSAWAGWVAGGGDLPEDFNDYAIRPDDVEKLDLVMRVVP